MKGGRLLLGAWSPLTILLRDLSRKGEEDTTTYDPLSEGKEGKLARCEKKARSTQVTQGSKEKNKEAMM